MKTRVKDAKEWLRRAFSEHAVGRAIALVMSGNVIAQAIILLALPIITRIYSPEQMSLLAVYVAILTMITVGACLRFEIAIPIPKDDETAINLAALAMLSTVSVATLVIVVLIVIKITNIQYITEHLLWNYAWLFPLGILFAGFFAAAQYWSIRQRRFFLIGRTRIFQAVVGVVVQIGAGLLNIIPLGLLLGHLLMTSAGFLGLFQLARKNDSHLIKLVSCSSMREAMVSHKDFPKFSIIEGLATTGAQQIIVLLISIISIGPEAGFFFIAMRALSAPISLITNAVSQVYLQKAPGHLRSGTLQIFTRKIWVAIAIVFVPPLVIFGLFSVPIFEIVLGPEWARVGEMVVFLLPMSLASLFSASVGMVMHITGRQKQMMWLNLFGFVMRVGGVALSAFVAPRMLIESYSAASLIVFIIYSWVFYWASGECADARRVA